MESKEERTSVARAKLRERRQRRETVTWNQVNPVHLQQFIYHAVDAGALVMLGRTSDGGSLVCYAKYEKELYRDYVRGADDFEEVALGLLDCLGFDLSTLAPQVS